MLCVPSPHHFLPSPTNRDIYYLKGTADTTCSKEVTVWLGAYLGTVVLKAGLGRGEKEFLNSRTCPIRFWLEQLSGLGTIYTSTGMEIGVGRNVGQD